MNDNQRLNVALTRAKYALWLVGDVNTMQGASGRERTRRGVWGELIDHCRKKGYVALFLVYVAFILFCDSSVS